MKVFAIANGKGGVGKTTLSGHLGVNLNKRDYYTVMLDTDPLACLQDWWELRQAGDLPLMSVPLSELKNAIPRLREAGVEFLIIDTPGFVSDEINAVLDMADLVVIASKASPLDLRATRKSLVHIEKCKVPMVFVLNEVRARTRIENEAILALSQYGRIGPVIHYKNDFVTSMIDGRTIDEIDPTNPGVAELDALAEYLLKQVGVDTIKPVKRDAPKEVATSAPKKGSGDADGKVVKLVHSRAAG